MESDMIKSTDRSVSWTDRLLYGDAWLTGWTGKPGLWPGHCKIWLSPAGRGWNVWECRLADLRTEWLGLKVLAGWLPETLTIFLKN
jgi:hypothetical protein